MKIKTMEFQLCIRKHNNAFLYENKELISDFVFIKNPKFHWLADPFIINIKNKHYLFVEAATKISWKGKLIYTEINPNNINKCKWKKCLKKDFHLSFPNVFIKDNELYMLPETSGDNSLAVYKCANNDFSSWKKEQTLIEGKTLVDTVFFNDYFVSYNISQNSFSLELYSKSSKELLDSIVDEGLTLRPAGKIFYTKHNDYVFVSQDCTFEYGCGLIFNKFSTENNKMIIRKDFEIDYKNLNKAFKRNNIVGIHTYNFDDTYEVIDIRKEHFGFLGLLKKVSDKLKNIFKKGKH